jgi:hypothetical protein
MSLSLPYTPQIERVQRFLSTSVNYNDLFNKFLYKFYSNYNKEIKIKDVKLYYDVIMSGVTCYHPSNIVHVTTVGGRLKFILDDNRIFYEEGNLDEFDNIRAMFNNNIRYNVIYCYVFLTLAYDNKFVVLKKINVEKFLSEFYLS